MRSNIISRNLFFVAILFLAIISLSAFLLSHLYSTSIPVVEVQPPRVRLGKVIESAVAISSKGSLIRLSGQEENNSDLTPSKNKDFMIGLWVRPGTLPEDGKRIEILSRLSGKGKNPAGYALSFARLSSEVYPVLYWKDSKGKGGWYQFETFRFSPKRWVFIGFSFYDNRYLGVYTARYTTDGQLEVRSNGGYELGIEVFPDSVGPLEVGSVIRRGFLGKIGSVGVFTPENLSRRVQTIFTQFVEDPMSVPSELKETEVVTWFSPSDNPVANEQDGKKSQGSQSQAVQFIGNATIERKGDHQKKKQLEKQLNRQLKGKSQ